MGTVGFYIFYGITWIITLLPLKILYIFSDILFVFLYYLPGYRKKVVTENLRNSFPEKSQEEIALIGRKFYRHLADIFIETLKLTNLSNKELTRRFTVSNPELLDRLYEFRPQPGCSTQSLQQLGMAGSMSSALYKIQMHSYI